MSKHTILIAAAMIVVLGGAMGAKAEPIIAGDDALHGSYGKMTITIFDPFFPGGFTETVNLSQVGDATIHRNEQVGTTIDTEIVSLNLSGTSINVGPLVARVGAANGVVEGGGTFGQITDVVQDNLDPGFPSGDPSSFFSGDSFFDVFFEIDFIGGTIYNIDPHKLGPVFITELPPIQTEYVSPLTFPLFIDIGVLGDHSDDPPFPVGMASALHHTTPVPGAVILGGIGLLSVGLVRRIRGRKRL